MGHDGKEGVYTQEEHDEVFGIGGPRPRKESKNPIGVPIQLIMGAVFGIAIYAMFLPSSGGMIKVEVGPPLLGAAAVGAFFMRWFMNPKTWGL